MPTTTGNDGSVRLAREVLAEAWHRYRRHLLPVVGLSLVGSAQRALVQFVGDDLAAPAAFALEAVTWGSRLLLVVLLWRWTIGSDARLRDVDLSECVRRLGRYARRQWPALLLQFAGLGVASLVFDTIPDLLVAPLVPPSGQAVYWAVLLAVKNPTIIAFSMVWMFALLHQALVRGADHRAGDDGKLLSERPAAG
ncbi:hypothetical protein [Pseudonocardia lacus]|jgi:hypothetical protein|uniref:hypothetical protein n=1 Tax=Pseudonocardia lacus TaxID=2835865 RepID=UPI001BDCF846|nr:hypothetical protein [Pseudonocardia lacus]